MTVPLKRRLVVLEDVLLSQLAANPTMVKEFPFIKSLVTVQTKGGGCCGGGQQGNNKSVFGAAKKILAGMDSARKRKLKELLGAQEVRVSYRDARDRLITLTF